MAVILINNTALRNNGDVALVRSLGRALLLRGHQVFVCGNREPSTEFDLPGLSLLSDVAGYRRTLFRRPGLSHIAALWLLLTCKAYRQADLVVGAPGGYLNSFYGFWWKLSIYRWSKLLGKRTAVFAQSVGPLNKQDQSRLRKARRFLDVLVVRDEFSQKVARRAGFSDEALLLSEDAIFLTPPQFARQSPRSKTVLISVREWRHEGRDLGDYVRLMHALIAVVLSAGFFVEFVSTCQGVPGYVDDSILADRIALSFTGDVSRISICKDRLSLTQLDEKIGSASFVIGTRLHMCLLAMIAGIPAFNISYEVKGIECYSYLGLADCSIDYNADPSVARLRLLEFLDNLDELRKIVQDRISIQHESANGNLDDFLSRIGVDA